MTDKPVNVRLALPSDEEALLPILMLAAAENAVMPMSQMRVQEMIINATRRGAHPLCTGHGVMGIIDGPKGIEGIISLTLARLPYTEKHHLEDICNYVHPECRKSNHAKDLLQFAKWIAETMKMPLFIGILTAKRLEAKRKFYQRLVKEVGSIYIHNPVYGALAEMG